MNMVNIALHCVSSWTSWFSFSPHTWLTPLSCLTFFWIIFESTFYPFSVFTHFCFPAWLSTFPAYTVHRWWVPHYKHIPLVSLCPERCSSMSGCSDRHKARLKQPECVGHIDNCIRKLSGDGAKILSNPGFSRQKNPQLTQNILTDLDILKCYQASKHR